MDISEMAAVTEASHQHIKNQEKEIEKLKETVATWQSNYTSMKTAYEQLLKSFEIVSEGYKE